MTPRTRLTSSAALLFSVVCACSAASAAGNFNPGQAGKLSIRVYLAGSPTIRFGCPAIKVTVQHTGGATMTYPTKAATALLPTPSGGCAASVSVPANMSVTVRAHAGNMQSRPATGAPGASGQWSNPITLAPGETRSIGIELYGTY